MPTTARPVTVRRPSRTASAPPMRDYPSMAPAQRTRYASAVHEAGHAVIATVLGETVGSVTVTPDHPTHTGNMSLATERFAGAHHAQIAYAGPYAEAYFRQGGPPTSALLRNLLASGGREDYAVMTAAGDTRPAEVPRLIANCWASITSLAEHLMINGSATQADVDRALRLPRDDQDGRHHALAVIRSGSAPGSFMISPPGSRG